MHGWLRSGERILLHQEELGDCVMGVVAGYLLWSEILPDGPRAITAMEQLLRRQMGTVGRMIVSVVEEVPSLGSLAYRLSGATNTGEVRPRSKTEPLPLRAEPWSWHGALEGEPAFGTRWGRLPETSARPCSPRPQARSRPLLRTG